MSPDEMDAAERLARIERLIDEFREAKRRRLLQIAIKLWRRTEERQRLVELDRPPTRIH